MSVERGIIEFESRPETMQGRVGESKIAKWLIARGCKVLPVYQMIQETGKGPQLFMDDKQLVAPDALCFKGNNAFWIEAKHKTAFSWYRKKEIWTTGIDKRHYEHYLQVDDLTPWPVWLLFLHKGGQAKDSPVSPAGLFGERLSILRNCVDHTSDRHGPTGMVYWNKDSLRKLDDYCNL